MRLGRVCRPTYPKYAERVAAKHPVTLEKRFIHSRPERKEDWCPVVTSGGAEDKSLIIPVSYLQAPYPP
jgi:hypothetical protein